MFEDAPVISSPRWVADQVLLEHCGKLHSAGWQLWTDGKPPLGHDVNVQWRIWCHRHGLMEYEQVASGIEGKCIMKGSLVEGETNSSEGSIVNRRQLGTSILVR